MNRFAELLDRLAYEPGRNNKLKLLTAYLEKFQNTPASTEEFEKMASAVAGGDLNYFFDQWLNSSGVPELKQEYTVFRTKDGYKVVGQMRQDLDLFRMPVELQIQTDGDPEYARVDVVGESSDFDVLVQRKPKAVVIDPREKLLRMSPDIRISVLVKRPLPSVQGAGGIIVRDSIGGEQFQFRTSGPIATAMPMGTVSSHGTSPWAEPSTAVV